MAKKHPARSYRILSTAVCASNLAKYGYENIHEGEHPLPLLVLPLLFQLRLSEGVLDISRSGLAKMGTVLKLEAVYGCGRDSLIGVHTLVLSYNQLQVGQKHTIFKQSSLTRGIARWSCSLDFKSKTTHMLLTQPTKITHTSACGCGWRGGK